MLCCAVPAYPDLTATHSSACPPPAHAPTSLVLLARRPLNSRLPALLVSAQLVHAQPAHSRRLSCFLLLVSRTALLLLAVCRAGLATLSTRIHVLLLTVHVPTYILTLTCTVHVCIQAQVHTSCLSWCPTHSVHCPSLSRPTISTSLSSAMCYHIAVNLGLIAGNVGNHGFCFGHPSANANLHQTGNFVPPNTHTTQTWTVTLCARLSLSHASALR